MVSGTENNSPGTVLTRTVCVNITGSLANLGMAGPQAAIWKPVEGKQPCVFGMAGDMDAAVATNQLRTALIHEVTLLEHRSTFPVPMGVDINCVPKAEMTDVGDSFAFTVLPHSKIASPHTIYRCDASAEEGLQWRKDYPRWTAANLETEGVLDVNNVPYVFVHQDHPVVGLLRANSQLIGCNIDEQPKIDDEWFKVTRQVLASCCQTLRQKVLNKVASNDLNLFQVQLHRLNATCWDDVNDVPTALQNFVADPSWDPDRVEREKRTHLQNFLATPYNYMARIQIKYEIQPPAA